MGTPCRIIRRNDDGTLTVISCHWDGRPSGVGRTLIDYYDNQAAVDRLMALGDLSMLGETPFENPSYWNFDACPQYEDYGSAEAYEKARDAWFRFRSRYCGTYRSRGEANTNAVTVPAGDYSLVRKEDGEWEFMWDATRWLFRPADGRWAPLTGPAISQTD